LGGGYPEAFKIPKEKLPDINHTGDVLGTLLPEVAKDLGLKAGSPWLLGGNDAATAHLGAGNFNAGDILNTVGSSEIITILSDKPIINDKYYLRKAVTKGNGSSLRLLWAGLPSTGLRTPCMKT
jgi:sugar (pentulose or hexulose) kinase